MHSWCRARNKTKNAQYTKYIQIDEDKKHFLSCIHFLDVETQLFTVYLFFSPCENCVRVYFSLLPFGWPLFMFIFNIWTIIPCVCALCAFYTYRQQDHGINLDCLTSAKIIIYYYSMRGHSYYLIFSLLQHQYQCHIANHTVRRYFTPHIQTNFYLTIIFICRQSHFSAVKNMSCRAQWMPFEIVRMFGSPLWCCV